MANENNMLPLGKQLRQITDSAKTNIEINNFTQKLVEAAERGEDCARFNDLRTELPTLIMNETVWEWFRVNELIPEGQIDQNTGAYVYKVKW